MQVILADKCGFCFGVKRAVKVTEKIAQSGGDTVTLGPLIHNPLETDRLKNDFGVSVTENLDSLGEGQNVIIRTHGIARSDLQILKERHINVFDATCPYVSKPQHIVESMSRAGYSVVIFGDASHPEVKSVASYSDEPPLIVSCVGDIELVGNLPRKVVVVSQTTKQADKFAEVVSYLVMRCYEVRVFNTICNATFENQDATRNLSRKADVMIVVGGKTSSNTKQLFCISKNHCDDSYLIESEDDLRRDWFVGKSVCGVTAGASTPDWIIRQVVDKIHSFAAASIA